MTTSNYKSTIGGAFSALGKTLMGIGILPQLANGPSKELFYIALSGFILDAIGGFLGHLFAADAKVVADLSTRVDANTTNIKSVAAQTETTIIKS